MNRRYSRRSVLMLGACGLSPLLLPRTSSASPTAAKAKNVLVIFEQGGVSQIDTWDPKPELPSEHRSPFESIQTKIPGVHFTRLLTRTSEHADKFMVVRCMTQPTPGVGNSHPKGSQYIFSGETPGGPVEMPDISSAVAMRMGSKASHLPSNILVPGTSEQAKESRIGFLPPAYQVFKTGGNPSNPSWSVPNLGLLGVDEKRFKNRRDLLSKLDIGVAGSRHVAGARAMRALMNRAGDMLTNPHTRKAFNIQGEPEAVKERYGTGHRGQCYLLGRKLIEAGVRFVTVDCREPMVSYRDGKQVRYGGGGNMNWDHHDAIYSESHTNIKGGGPGAGRYGIHTWPMMGSTDQALSALIEDMDRSGLLEETLLCFVSEFGRTPKINNRQGRDHWTHAFSFMFAGAGVRGGQVVGSTDKHGGYITSSMAYTIDDFAATVYEKLGFDRHEPFYTPDDRPIYVTKNGNPILEVMA
ncbi:MAG: DUF1501 domain-containing protein [Pirellulales bacterium]